MEKYLFKNSEKEIKQNLEILERLIIQCQKCNITIIELPFVDSFIARPGGRGSRLLCQAPLPHTFRTRPCRPPPPRRPPLPRAAFGSASAAAQSQSATRAASSPPFVAALRASRGISPPRRPRPRAR